MSIADRQLKPPTWLTLFLLVIVHVENFLPTHATYAHTLLMFARAVRPSQSVHEAMSFEALSLRNRALAIQCWKVCGRPTRGHSLASTHSIYDSEMANINKWSEEPPCLSLKFRVVLVSFDVFPLSSQLCLYAQICVFHCLLYERIHNWKRMVNALEWLVEKDHQNDTSPNYISG